MFKPMCEWDNVLDYKKCPNCHTFASQVVGYDTQDIALDILHQCSKCGAITREDEKDEVD
jgi:rubredoxin